MNEQEKRQLQNAALMIAEHQRKDEPKVKEYRDRIAKIKKSIEELESSLNNLRRDMAVEAMNLRTVLITSVPEDLRD